LGSLEQKPPHPFLLRMRQAEDERALAALAGDAETAALARDAESVRLLWEVCQVPDFQAVLSDAHTRLLARVFRFLRGPLARIEEDFLAAQVREIDRSDGDLEELLSRIAAIRTWTYISHRASWVPEPRFWQERTRAVEDRLSDALHQRLTEEFVDRVGTVIARHDPAELVTSVAESGEVLVQGLRAGFLEGFRFRPEQPRSDASRALLAAANRALQGLVRERVEALAGESDAAITLGPGAEIAWRGSPVARLAAGESALAPRVEVLGSDLLDAALKERVRRRLADWLEADVARTLAPLLALREKAPAGTARGLAFALAEGLGAVTRRSVARQVEALAADDRRELGRLGVSIGRLSLFLPALSSAEAMRLRARLYAVQRGLASHDGPTGAPSATNDPSRPAEFFLACSYFAAGPRIIRLDRLERAAAILSRLSRNGPFVPPSELARILGCRAEELGDVLAALGYDERDGRFERRARRGAPAGHRR
ncbi:MAG TPA: disulfide oxidoreductase, partial [Vicinamibacteria bacterium]